MMSETVWVVNIPIVGVAGVYTSREVAEEVCKEQLEVWWPEQKYIEKSDQSNTLYFFAIPYGTRADAAVHKYVLDERPVPIIPLNKLT